MSEPPSRNLTLQLGDFVPLLSSLKKLLKKRLHVRSTCCFLTRFRRRIFRRHSTGRWIPGSHILHLSDLKRFEKEGFGAYRFHSLGGFRELGFEKGALRFVPARRKHSAGWRGFYEDLADAWGWSRRESFHVTLKSSGRGTVLYLASPFVDRGDWSMLCEDKPARVVGSPHFGRVYWTALAERLGVNIDILSEERESSGSTTTKIFGVRTHQNSDSLFNDSNGADLKGGPNPWENMERGSGS
jgi:hypothetical protein